MSNHQLSACGGVEGLRNMTMRELEEAHRHLADTMRASAYVLKAAASSSGGFAIPGGRLQATVFALAEACEEAPVLLSAIADEIRVRHERRGLHYTHCRNCERIYAQCTVFCEQPASHPFGFCSGCKAKVSQ